jgi:hypothetical protein
MIHGRSGMAGGMRGLCVFALLPVLLACNDGPSGPEAYVRIENVSSAWTVTDVYMVRPDEQHWGSDMLTAYVEPGETRTLTVEPDTYDIRIESDHTQGAFEQLGVEILEQYWVVIEVSDTRIGFR